jgi:hypothetical protein
MSTRSAFSLVAITASVFVTAVSIGACDRRANPLDPGRPVQESDGAQLQPPGLDAQLAAVRAATAAFHNVETAMAAGYLFGEPCVQRPLGAMGIHAVNPPLIQAPGVDAERPEVLLYFPEADGRLKLIGVEYLQFVLLRYPDGIVRPWVHPTDIWPSTHQVVTPTPELFGRTFDGPMPGHNATMPWHWDLHVWTWMHNPAGMFAEGNPTLACP